MFTVAAATRTITDARPRAWLQNSQNKQTFHVNACERKPELKSGKSDQNNAMSKRRRGNKKGRNKSVPSRVQGLARLPWGPELCQLVYCTPGCASGTWAARTAQPSLACLPFSSAGTPVSVLEQICAYRLWTSRRHVWRLQVGKCNVPVERLVSYRFATGSLRCALDAM